MKQYSSYKDSGVEWIGEIPKHWTVMKTKYLVDNSKYYQIGDGDHGLIIPDDYLDQGIPYIRVQNLSWNGNLKMHGMVFISEQVHLKNKKSILLPNDIVIAKTGATVGKICMLDNTFNEYNTTSSVGKITIDNHKHYPRFFLYYFQSKPFQELIFITSIIKSAQPGFNIDDLTEFIILAPSLREQKQIAGYLDKETARIDSLIERAERKIELLKEQRDSIINQAVTKGLDPNVEMKDSGVEWIGEIPKGWDVKKFGLVSTLETGNTPSKTQENLYFTDDDDGFPWVKPSDLNVGLKGVSHTESKLTKEGKEKSRIIPKDSILVCCIGNTAGKYSISNREISTNQQINSIMFNYEVLPRYGLYFMDVLGRDLLKWMNIVTLPIISKGDLSQQKILTPPENEQKQIADYLDKKTDRIDSIVELESKRMELLEEYRQSLISNAVTGKIDVRGMN